VVWEWRHENPIVNLRILRNRNLAMATVLIAVVGSILYGTTVVLPIFMQTLLRYTATISGLAMTPRGIGSFFSMLIIGRLVTRFDSRALMALGFMGIALSCWSLSQISMNITRADISWPLVLNGLSMGFIFVPLTTLSVATLEQHEIHQATGIYNLMRNIGGAFGISVLISLQTRGTQIHQAYLSAHFAAGDLMYQAHLRSVTMALRALAPQMASTTAHALIYNELLNQAALLAIIDTFQRLAVLSLCCLPLVLLFRRIRHPRVPEIGAEEMILSSRKS
jgi:DHA2 family multidrug resistance protein